MNNVVYALHKLVDNTIPYEGDFIGVFSSMDTLEQYIQAQSNLKNPQLRRMVKDHMVLVTHTTENGDTEFSNFYAHMVCLDEPKELLEQR